MASSPRVSRRAFITWLGGAGAGFYLLQRLPGTKVPIVLAQVPGGPGGGLLDPTTVPKFQTPILIPPVMPRAAVLPQRGGKPIDYYEMIFRLTTNPNNFPLTACEPIEELPRLHENPALVPHYLPGKHPALNEMTERYNIPLEAVLGGPETMYPEYRKRLKDKYVPPAPVTPGGRGGRGGAK